MHPSFEEEEEEEDKVYELVHCIRVLKKKEERRGRLTGSGGQKCFYTISEEDPTSVRVKEDLNAPKIGHMARLMLELIVGIDGVASGV